MPLYDFLCDECGTQFEELVMSPKAADQILCPECNSPEVQRQLSLVARMSNTSSTGSSSQAACSPGGG